MQDAVYMGKACWNGVCFKFVLSSLPTWQMTPGCFLTQNKGYMACCLGNAASYITIMDTAAIKLSTDVKQQYEAMC